MKKRKQKKDRNPFVAHAWRRGHKVESDKRKEISKKKARKKVTITDT